MPLGVVALILAPATAYPSAKCGARAIAVHDQIGRTYYSGEMRGQGQVRCICALVDIAAIVEMPPKYVYVLVKGPIQHDTVLVRQGRIELCSLVTKEG